MSVEARTILQPVAARLATAGIASAKTDARLLLGVVLGRDGAVLPHEDVADWPDASQQRFETLIERRLAGEPVSRIRGWREFWSLRFHLCDATLDPRPDSETLVENALAFAGGLAAAGTVSDLRLLDLGTGSGCLLLACLSDLVMARGVGIDINPGAVQMASQNAENLGFSDRAAFYQRGFSDALDDLGRFDIILCNPPYIPTAQIAHLAPEVAVFDPHMALDGGVDGLLLWRQLMPVFSALLTERGAVFAEIGEGQAGDVGALARAEGLVWAQSHADLSGIERCLVFKKDVQQR